MNITMYLSRQQLNMLELLRKDADYKCVSGYVCICVCVSMCVYMCVGMCVFMCVYVIWVMHIWGKWRRVHFSTGLQRLRRCSGQRRDNFVRLTSGNCQSIKESRDYCRRTTENSSISVLRLIWCLWFTCKRVFWYLASLHLSLSLWVCVCVCLCLSLCPRLKARFHSRNLPACSLLMGLEQGHSTDLVQEASFEAG